MQLVSQPASRLWQSYCNQLVKRPLISRCLTGVVGAVLSDGAAQLGHRAATRSRANSTVKPSAVGLVDTEWHYDWMRTGRLALYSMVIATPVATGWFWWLDKTISPANPKAPLAVATKIALDQVFMAPAGLAMFLAGMKTLEGRPQDVVPLLQEKYTGLLKANYAVWPAVHLVNFGLVPPSQRILYINAVSILWGSLMSHWVMGSEGKGGAGHANRTMDEPLLEEAYTSAAGPH